MTIETEFNAIDNDIVYARTTMALSVLQRRIKNTKNQYLSSPYVNSSAKRKVKSRAKRSMNLIKRQRNVIKRAS